MIRPMLFVMGAAMFGTAAEAETGTVQVGPSFHVVAYADPSAHNTYSVSLGGEPTTRSKSVAIQTRPGTSSMPAVRARHCRSAAAALISFACAG